MRKRVSVGCWRPRRDLHFSDCSYFGPDNPLSCVEISCRRMFTWRNVARRERTINDTVQTAARNIEAMLPRNVAIVPFFTIMSNATDSARSCGVAGAVAETDCAWYWPILASIGNTV